MKQYGGLPEEFTSYEQSKVVIVPVPYDGTSTWLKGADKGPEALIEASCNMEVYDISTDSEVHTVGIHTMDPILENADPESMCKAVYQTVKTLFKKKKFPIVIGGEHSVSIGAIQAAAEAFEDITILQLDAHADLREEYEGSPYNHACVMARAREHAPILQVGIRSMSIEESDTIQPERVFYAEHIHTASNWMFEILNKVTNNVYITIDLDVFDPSIMSSTGTPEPGGLLWYQVLEIIKKVSDQANIVGFDIVELMPSDHNRAPDFLASKLLYTVLTYKFISGRQ